MKGTLVDAYSELFAYVCHLKRFLTTSSVPPEEVRARIQDLLSVGDQRAKKKSAGDQDVRLVRFALCAWIDEYLINISWDGRESWKRGLLQTQYFQTTNAGEEFFSYLNSLQPDQQSVRAIYYHCLCLGFRGRYCRPGDDNIIKQLIESQLAALDNTRWHGLFDTAPLFDEGYPFEHEEPGVLGHGSGGIDRGRILLAAGPAVCFLVLFLIYTFVLSGMAEDILGPILGLGG